MTDEVSDNVTVDAIDDGKDEPIAPAKPSTRARLSILLIGGAAILGVVLMCIIFTVIAATR